MSSQKARSELMKFDSGPAVGTVRSEKLSAVRLGVIAQSCTTGMRGGAAELTGANTRPIVSTARPSITRIPTTRTNRPGASMSPSDPRLRPNPPREGRRRNPTGCRSGKPRASGAFLRWALVGDLAAVGEHGEAIRDDQDADTPAKGD